MGGPGATEIERVLIRGNVGNGGILQFGGELTVRDSTITNNTSDFGGGIGIQSGALSPTETLVVNSTITGNSAKEFGGGINISGPQTKLTIASSTITDNKADSDDSGGGDGGGFFNNAPTGGFPNALAIGSSIVARNTVGHAPPVSPDCLATTYPITSYGNNLIGAVDPTTCIGFVNADQKNVNPLIGALGDNGGPTDTIALLPGSPAIDNGIAPPQGPIVPLCPEADQRALPRGGFNGRCDVGAFELQKPLPAQNFPPVSPAPPATKKKCKKKKKKRGKKKKCKKKKKKGKR